MSTRTTSKSTLTIKGLYDSRMVRLSIKEKEGGTSKQIEINCSAALEVAVEILMVSGHHDLAIQIHAMASTMHAEKKLQERRDAIAASLGMPPYNKIVRQLHAAAIDRIIDLEDGQDSGYKTRSVD